MSDNDFSEDYSSEQYNTALFNYENNWSRDWDYCWHSRRTLSTVEDEHYQDLNLDGLLDDEEEQNVVNHGDNEKKNEVVPQTSTHQHRLDTEDLVLNGEQLVPVFKLQSVSSSKNEQQVVKLDLNNKKPVYEDIRVDRDQEYQVSSHSEKVADNHQEPVDNEMCSSSYGASCDSNIQYMTIHDKLSQSYQYLESPVKQIPKFKMLPINRSEEIQTTPIHQTDSHMPHAVMKRKREHEEEETKKMRGKSSKKAKTSKIMIERWIQGKQTGTVAKSERPPLSFPLLCSLACLNSPTGKVTPSDVYSFVLHHWCYYRFCNPNWKNSIRHHLTDEKMFGKTKGNGDVLFYHLLKPQDVKFTPDNAYIEQDPRGKSFYIRLLKGEIGLPRQLFYYVIGLCAPQFAGPENAALFYHLLSIKIIPKKFSSMFREYCQEHNGREPKFVEENARFTSAMLDVENIPSFGINANKGTEPRLLSTKELDVFNFDINYYYELQKYYQSVNSENWRTPPLDNAI